jgi:hypothetical protein
LAIAAAPPGDCTRRASANSCKTPTPEELFPAALVLEAALALAVALALALAVIPADDVPIALQSSPETVINSKGKVLWCIGVRNFKEKKKTAYDEDKRRDLHHSND